MNREYHDLHCGACMEKFDGIDGLNEHLKSCVAAIVLLPSVNMLFFVGDDNPGHPLGSLIFSIHKNVHLIERYAYCISDELDSLSRSKIHRDLCGKLYLNHQRFKPFESQDIKHIPSREEAKKILWYALGGELRKIRTGDLSSLKSNGDD